MSELSPALSHRIVVILEDTIQKLQILDLYIIKINLLL